MAELSPLDIQGIYAKNNEEISLEQAKEVLGLLIKLAGTAVRQTLSAEQEMLNESLLPLKESSLKKQIIMFIRSAVGLITNFASRLHIYSMKSVGISMKKEQTLHETIQSIRSK
jgi:hypothetical protein